MTGAGESPVAPALRLLVACVLVAVPLAFDPRSGHVGSRPKYLVLVLGGAAAAVLLTAQCGAGGRPPWRRTPLFWPLLGYAGWAAVATAASGHRAEALVGFPGSYDGLWAQLSFAALALALAAGAAFDTAAVRRTLAVLWFGTTSAVLLFGFGQLLDRIVSPDTGWDWARPATTPQTIGSTLGNPNHVASFLAIALPLGLALAVLGGRRTRIASAVIGAGLVMTLAATLSRGAVGAAVAGVAVLVLLFRHELAPHRSRAVAAVAATAVAAGLLTVVLGAAGVTKIDPSAIGRVGPGSTTDLRLELWSSAWRMAADHPVAGVGPDVYPVEFPRYRSDRFILVFGAFTVANGAHNLFLNTLANLGWGGLLAFLAVLAVLAGTAVRTWRRVAGGGGPTGDRDRETRVLLAGLLAAIVAYLVQGTFNNQELSLSLVFWTSVGLAAGLGASMSAAEEAA